MTRVGRVDADQRELGRQPQRDARRVDEQAVVPAEHTGVCLTRSWATATSGGSLLEGSRRWPEGRRLPASLNWWATAKWTSLASQNQ